MNQIAQDRIRDRAYRLWDEAGQPEGREDEFWYRAERELAEEDEVDTSEAAADPGQPPLVSGRLS
jgi:Protein of unknown function (DUF2934).